MPLQNINENLAVTAMAGSLFLMLKNKAIPWHEKLIYFLICSIAAYFTGEATVSYFHLDAGVGGILSFISGILVLPLLETALGYIKDPQKLVDLYKQTKGEKKDE